jgi:hypothetical protein
MPAAPPSSSRPKPASAVTPTRKPVEPTPRSLLKGESVVAYLHVRPWRHARTRCGAARAWRTQRRLICGNARAAILHPPSQGGKADGGEGGEGEAGEAGAAGAAAPAAAAAKPKLRAAATAKPGSSTLKGGHGGATARPAGAADAPAGTVDVDAWLADRRAKDAAREQLRWARVHNDAKFIEKLERQQEVRNKALHDEEAAKAAAAAAAANWQTVPFAPLSADTKDVKAPDATGEEALFRKDAERLFGEAPAQ